MYVQVRLDIVRLNLCFIKVTKLLVEYIIFSLEKFLKKDKGLIGIQIPS